MKRIPIFCVLIVLFTGVHADRPRIYLGNTQTSFWQIDLYTGCNIASVLNSDRTVYIMEGLQVQWKKELVLNILSFNVGVDLAGNRILGSLIEKDKKDLDFNYFSVGIPFSFEVSKLHNHSSFYFNLGMNTLFYSCQNAKNHYENKGNPNYFLFAPKMEAGLYLTTKFGKLKLGGFAQRYMSSDTNFIFTATGRTFVGLNAGFAL